MLCKLYNPLTWNQISCMTFCVILFYYMYILQCMSILVVAIKKIDQAEGEETRLLLERDRNRGHAKSKVLEFFSQNFVVSRAKKHQSTFFTRVPPLAAHKMVHFAPKRNARYTSGIPFPTLLSFFFTPTLIVCTVSVRSYADVITKFSRIHTPTCRSPIFFSYWAPRASTLRYKN